MSARTTLSIPNLPTETLLEIASYLTPDELRIVRLTNRRINQILSSMAFRHIRVYLGTKRVKFTELSRTDLASYIKSIVIMDFFKPRFISSWSKLETAIYRLPFLHSLRFTYTFQIHKDVPATFIQSAFNHPSLSIFDRLWDPKDFLPLASVPRTQQHLFQIPMVAFEVDCREDESGDPVNPDLDLDLADPNPRSALGTSLRNVSQLAKSQHLEIKGLRLFFPPEEDEHHLLIDPLPSFQFADFPQLTKLDLALSRCNSHPVLLPDDGPRFSQLLLQFPALDTLCLYIQLDEDEDDEGQDFSFSLPLTGLARIPGLEAFGEAEMSEWSEVRCNNVCLVFKPPSTLNRTRQLLSWQVTGPISFGWNEAQELSLSQIQALCRSFPTLEKVLIHEYDLRMSVSDLASTFSLLPRLQTLDLAYLADDFDCFLSADSELCSREHDNLRDRLRELDENREVPGIVQKFEDILSTDYTILPHRTGPMCSQQILPKWEKSWEELAASSSLLLSIDLHINLWTDPIYLYWKKQGGLLQLVESEGLDEHAEVCDCYKSSRARYLQEIFDFMGPLTY